MNKVSLFFKATNNILGINERNLSFTKKYNRGKARRIADNKYRSYKILKKVGVPQPEILKVLKTESDINSFSFDLLPKSFVIKPAFGFGGTGNLLIFGKNKKTGNWVGVNGKQYSEDHLKLYCLSILSKSFSLEFAKKDDFVIIQERVNIDSSLKRISSKKGLPDIRIILYKTIPIMAMLRLPTKQSGGKSNLHLGGIGVGIDLATGTTTYAVTRNEPIEKHPDTGINLSGFFIPHWKETLKIAIKAVDEIGLKFGAVDVVLDRDRGPLVLEVNARTGLGIQIANQEGLKGRIARVKGIKPKSRVHARKIGMNLFGGEIEESVADITGMQVVGFIAMANFYGPSERCVKRVKVKNDTGALYTSIDRDLAYELGFEQALKDFDALDISSHFIDKGEAVTMKREVAKYVKDHPEILALSVVKSGNITTIRPKVGIEVEMEGLRVPITANIADRSNMLYKAVIGRRTLRKNFLVDSNKLFNRYKN